MNKKVCLWCERWGAGGIESFAVNILSSMDRTGLDITILTTQKESDVFDARLESLGIPLKTLLSEPVKDPIRRTATVFRLLRRELEQEHYDAIHLNIYHGLALYYAVMAKKAGIPVRIAHSHNSSLRKSLTRPLKQLVHWASRAMFAGAVTDFCACSDVAAGWMFPERVQNKVSLIANGVDTGRFAFQSRERDKLRAELGIADKLALCCVGRICDQKNQSFLVEAFAELLKLRPDAVLYLAGSEDDGGRARAKAAELGISSSVVFLGVTSWIPQLLWACDGFVLPSLFEGNPVSAIEAQASGIRCFLSANISREAQVSDLVEFIPLEDGPIGWAMKLLAGLDYQRRDTSDQLKAAGYDAAVSAEALRKLYMRLT